MKRYVVQPIANGGRVVDIYSGAKWEAAPVAQFDSLDYARNHCRLNHGGSIWRGEDVMEILKSGCLAIRRGATPLEHIA